ncbi:MAG: hypothetical protein KJO88_05500 [Gammaproteobacteria bacterium]|nr:hypothetical protein [Gammaproteobacteria bacterium]
MKSVGYHSDTMEIQLGLSPAEARSIKKYFDFRKDKSRFSAQDLFVFRIICSFRYDARVLVNELQNADIDSFARDIKNIPYIHLSRYKAVFRREEKDLKIVLIDSNKYLIRSKYFTVDFAEHYEKHLSSLINFGNHPQVVPISHKRLA